MTPEEIHREFERWISDPITKEIFKTIKQVRDGANIALTNSDVIFDKDSSQKLARLVGYREGLDVLLQVSADYIEVDDDEVPSDRL